MKASAVTIRSTIVVAAPKQAPYLFVVKANQPTLLDRCAATPWQDVPVGDRTRDRAHDRVELRILKLVATLGISLE